jgi:hypothetical protein
MPRPIPTRCPKCGVLLPSEHAYAVHLCPGRSAFVRVSPRQQAVGTARRRGARDDKSDLVRFAGSATMSACHEDGWPLDAEAFAGGPLPRAVEQTPDPYPLDLLDVCARLAASGKLPRRRTVEIIVAAYGPSVRGFIESSGVRGDRAGLVRHNGGVGRAALHEAGSGPARTRRTP